MPSFACKYNETHCCAVYKPYSIGNENLIPETSSNYYAESTIINLGINEYKSLYLYSFFFFNDTATTEIYTLSLHDALPISLELCALEERLAELIQRAVILAEVEFARACFGEIRDRKSTRLNSSHVRISYAVFCL